MHLSRLLQCHLGGQLGLMYFLKLWLQLRILEMTDVHQCSKVDFPFVSLCFQNNLFFGLWLCPTARLELFRASCFPCPLLLPEFSTNFWTNTASKNIHLNAVASGTRRRTRNSLSKVSWVKFSNPTSRRLDAGRWRGDKWFLDNHKEIYLSSSITLYLESNCTCRQKNHFLFQ